MPRTANKTTTTKATNIENSEKIEEIILENTSEKIEEVILENSIDTENVKLNMDEKITLKNIANWMVGFNKLESNGEVNVNAYGSVRITRAEAISQFENGNKLICGVGNGEHSTLYIDDKPTRDYLEYKGNLIDKNFVKKIFDIEGINDFRDTIKETFITRAEKLKLINLIRECKFNDFNKVRECEIHCNMNV